MKDFKDFTCCTMVLDSCSKGHYSLACEVALSGSINVSVLAFVFSSSDQMPQWPHFSREPPLWSLLDRSQSVFYFAPQTRLVSPLLHYRNETQSFASPKVLKKEGHWWICLKAFIMIMITIHGHGKETVIGVSGDMQRPFQFRAVLESRPKQANISISKTVLIVLTTPHTHNGREQRK